MTKRALVGLVVVAILGVGLFLLYQTKPAKDGGSVPVPQENSPVPLEKGAKPPVQAGDSEGVPDKLLDRMARKKVEPPKRPEIPQGVVSSEIPEDNGMHWFILAAERMPELPWELRDTCEAILDHGYRHDPRIVEKIEECSEAFEAVRKGLEVGNIMMPLRDPEKPMGYSARWRDVTRMMTVKAMMQANKGNFDDALDTLDTVVRFAAESSRGGMLMNYLIGFAMENIGTRKLANTLRTPGVSAEQCRNAAARLDALEKNAPRIVDAMSVEADMAQHWFDKHSGSLDKVHEQITSAVKDSGEEGKRFAETATPEQCLETYREHVENLRKQVPLYGVPVHEFDESAFQEISAGNLLSEKSLGIGLNILKNEALRSSGRRGAAIVAALEAYQRDNGNYPATLDALAPAVLPELPPDPFTGKPFGYTRQNAGYLLYSAGPNMKDDGGKGKPWNPKADDYVIVRAD